MLRFWPAVRPVSLGVVAKVPRVRSKLPEVVTLMQGGRATHSACQSCPIAIHLCDPVSEALR
jgi:hypothetical protein